MNLIGLIQNDGFQVYLVSDHGNIEAKGMGLPDEGLVADFRDERVRVYPDQKLRVQVKNRFPECLE